MIRIFRVLVPATVFSLLLSESLLTFLCYAAAAYVAPEMDGEVFLFYDFGWQRVALMMGLLVTGLYFTDLYSDLRVRSRFRLAQQLWVVMGITLVMQALIGYWDPEWMLPKRVVLVGSVFAFAALFVWRLVFSVGVTRAVGAMRVLFVGATPTVAALEGLLARNSQYGMMPVGYWAGAAGGAAEMLGEVERLRPDRIVVARPEELRPGWVDAFLELHFGGVRTERASELYEDTLGRVCLAEVRPEQVIYEGLFDPPASSLKLQEIYSRGIAALLALATLPLAVLIAALVKLTSRGPLLEREVRLGLDDRPVTLLRFRWWEERDGVRRPTRIGRGLRLFNLDALPRLHNVLRGDLSLIGPAAVRPEFAAALSERLPLFRQRHKVKPGLMGWAQICAGAIEELPDELELLEYDLYYLKNLSPSLDTFVLLRWLKTWLHGFFKIDS